MSPSTGQVFGHKFLTQLAHSMLHSERMRLCLLSFGFLFTTACGLSMNPDLPSTEENDPLPFDPAPTEFPGNDDINLGQDEALPPPPAFEAPSSAAGGSSAISCAPLGGEGGATTCGGVL